MFCKNVSVFFRPIAIRYKSMFLRVLLILAGLGLATLTPAAAMAKKPQSTNPNVKRAMKKTKKVKPAKYKAPKKSRPPARATYGVR